MRSWVLGIFVISGFLICHSGCSDDPEPVSLPTVVPVQFGAFVFDVTDEWKITRTADTLYLVKDSCTIKVHYGYNLTFLLFSTNPPTQLPVLTSSEMEMAEDYFPSPYYPDSLPAQLGTLRFKVSIDSLLRRYVCYSDSIDFPSELLTVHPQSGNCIHFETTSGFTSADSLFDLIASNIRFAPDTTVPCLLEFSFTDTTISCCNQLLPDGTENPYNGKTLMRINDTIIEYWTAPKYPSTVVETLDHSMQVNGDSIFLSAISGIYPLEFIDQLRFIASPPRVIMIQCDCWTCVTVHYKIRVPGGGNDYKVKFTGETVSFGEVILLE